MKALTHALLLAAAGRAAGVLPPLGSMVGIVAPGDIEMPGAGFPGATAALSNVAFPSGQQAPRLRYWPQLNYGLANRTLLGCWKTQVLHDTRKGWPGVCINLAKNTGAPTQAACRQFCEEEPRCPVWQFNNHTDPPQCWVGFGTHCANRNGRGTTDITVQAAQRIMHGDVHVMMPLKGMKIAHLFEIGKFEAGDDVLGVDRCKAWCYSVIGCQFWQYSASAGGCFVDAPMFSTQRNSKPTEVVQYPLTSTAGLTPDPSFQDGEYIVHYCPPFPASTTPRVQVPVFNPPSPEGGTTQSSGGAGFFGSWTFLGLLILPLCGCYWYMQTRGQGKKGSKRNAYANRDGDSEYEPSQQGGGGKYGGYEDDNMPLMNQPPTPDPYRQRPGAPAMSNPYGQQPPQQDRNAYGQQMAPTTYGPGVGRGPAGASGRGPSGAMPPPTQLVDFGQAQGAQGGRVGAASMAPTQLMNQGLPFPSPGQPYPQGRGGY